MKDLGFWMSSPPKRTNLNRVIKLENRVRNVELIEKLSRFRLSVNHISSTCPKWPTVEIQRLHRATRKKNSVDGSFHEAIGSILALAQCFAMMPVVGVKSVSASKLKFKWMSFRTIYSIFGFILVLFSSGCQFWITFSNEIHFDGMIPVIFFGSAVYGMFCFGVLAKKWPMIMRHWESVEAKMPRYRTQREKRKLTHQLKMLAIVMLTGALVEHLLYLMSLLYYVKTCRDQEDTVTVFFLSNLGNIFRFVPYSLWIAFFGQFTSEIATFCWNYMDLFVMMISVGLASRFKQINEDLQKIKGEHMPEDFWALRRTQYQWLCGLCAVVDDSISQITFLSFSHNLFFISVQLLRSIRPMSSIPHGVYFWYSLAFLIARTLGVSLYASQIYDESKKTIRVLRAVPSWSAEVQRFSEHVVNDTVALTGMHFFYLTRNLILSVAGTVITYELVLIQLRTEDKTPVGC